MRVNPVTISLAFAAGCLGGLANSFFVWFFGAIGFTPTLGVKIAPAFSPAWLYPRLVWGGIWGWLFLLNRPRWPLPLRGLLYSLGPTLVMYFLVFPYMAHQTVLGLSLGALTPVFVAFYNAVWGVTAGLWLSLTAAEGKGGQKRF